MIVLNEESRRLTFYSSETQCLLLFTAKTDWSPVDRKLSNVSRLTIWHDRHIDRLTAGPCQCCQPVLASCTSPYAFTHPEHNDIYTKVIISHMLLNIFFHSIPAIIIKDWLVNCGIKQKHLWHVKPFIQPFPALLAPV